MEKKYQKRVFCTNCIKDRLLDIPIGTTVEDYLNEAPKCPTCGNKTLRKRAGE